MINYLRTLLSAADQAAALQRVADRTNREDLHTELVKALGTTGAGEEQAGYEPVENLAA